MTHASSYKRIHVAIAWLLMTTIDFLLLLTDAATVTRGVFRDLR
jgi:hypothetical protein